MSIIFVILGFREAAGCILATSLCSPLLVARLIGFRISEYQGRAFDLRLKLHRIVARSRTKRKRERTKTTKGTKDNEHAVANRTLEKHDAQEATMCTRHYHSPWPLSIQRYHHRRRHHHRRPNPYTPLVPVTTIPFRIRRDGNLAESFAIYDGANAPAAHPSVLTSVYTRER